ncbi:MAG TPA: hypothetical protein VGR70_09855 [Stellaceae bacterium]|nr:hypothetical protein [Stellaceae bacterium]
MSDKLETDGVAAVHLIVDNAPALPPAPEEARGDDETPPKRPTRDLPDECPVKPLGMNGLVRYYLDESQQVIELSLREHSRNNLSGIFGNRNYLLSEYFPRFSKDGKMAKGFAADEAADTLMRAAAKKGVWDPFQKLRGPGAWLGDEGELVWHCGDKVLYGDAWQLCGELGRFIYPTAPPGPKPATIRAAGGYAGPAQELLTLIKTWNWRRPDLDPYLLLGWIMAALIGGALKWRPAVWITGDRATGKTTLIDKVLREIFDADSGGAFILSDATAAGIWQHTKHSTLPIILDELEPDKDGRREKQLIALARLAASGGVTVRGGADHGGAEFTIRSCFAFSSILVPPLQPQDRSRLAILELENLENRKAPVIDPKKMRALGARLRRRLVDQWSRFADTFEAYAAALSEAGHQGRGADQYGTLLACQDLALQDTPPSSDELTDWGEMLKASVMAERADDVADHHRCWQHLLTFPIDAWRGGTRRTVAQWIADALRDQNDEPATANAVLETYGLKVRVEPVPYRTVNNGEPALPPPARYWLYVANAHQGLAQIFADTHWTARSGASAVWVQALRRMENAEASEPQKFAGVTIRATKLPIDSMAGKANG